MNKIPLLAGIALTLFSLICRAERPAWVDDSDHPSYQHSQSYCAPITNQVYDAKLIAGAKVRGAIAQALDSHITATSSLVKRSTESEADDIVSEQLIEQIEVKSSHTLSGFTVINQGVYSIEGRRYFCLWAGIAPDV
ncbi:hypothetical protein Y5S_03317 [Alcanivorax nanhaiticus]|jgi:hypothetical protein|uniref:LPP20 lipoprotein n=1 Tax=Alcanivorax nanhaiticus TaxID=1177154 RepID=A0A095SFC2_9GAMM|nr:hypothetical protein [Alcanivorax nanhaiticus]KGD63331.1 hypothetical protein Y5S_03317 [Alcanivorax nanhaiticus]